jgi:hypothetical protein
MASFTRRRLLASLPMLAFAGRALALGEDAHFCPAVAQHSGNWEGRLSGIRRLMAELTRRTSVEAVPDVRPLSLASEKLFDYPFLYLGGDSGFAPFAQDEVDNLRRYLTYGGFLLADANDGSDGEGFDASFRRELKRVLPDHGLAPLPSAHVVFKSFFLLDAAPGRLFNKPQLQAATLGKRAAVIYSQNDLMGAFVRSDSGDYELDVTPGGEEQRELAYRLGINLCMYALCLDYKDDAVHLPLILKKRR